MSTEPLIQALDEMIRLHKSLHQLAKNKTDIVIKGEIVALQSLLKEESKHVQAIKKTEAEIQELIKHLQTDNKIYDQYNLNTLIELADADEKAVLISLKNELTQQINLVNEQNKVNQQLLEQSLQFVNASLDILIPDTDSFNYDPNERPLEQKGRSIFDSKA
ncbi:flagellar protein FlgN [Bacillus sp. CGMCC 1.16607]|uniref:flagellar protein FlgN n=1 Tax=Bacillus sp. CGMCC 1.16607 TaxID=3351842 RepID=UPI0036321B60